MKLLIALIFSLPLLAGPKKPPSSLFGSFLGFLASVAQMFPGQRPADPNQVQFNRQRFNVIRNTGEENACFFLALQQAGIALTRELAVEILTGYLEIPEARLVIAQDLAQDWRDRRFIPRSSDLPRETLADWLL